MCASLVSDTFSRMRAVLIAIALGACGDNTEPPRLEPLAALPSGTDDVAFDRGNVVVVRITNGVVQRFLDERWRTVPLGDAGATDFGSDNDGAVLAMTTRGLYVVDGTAVREVGPSIVDAAGDLTMPMQVPSGNRYVTETGGVHRSFVLSLDATAWVETPPMFVRRPIRTYEQTLFAAVGAGVERFEPDGSRPLAVACEQLGKATCTELVLGGEQGSRLYLGDRDKPEVIVVDGSAIERVRLPAGAVPVGIAAGIRLVVVLAKHPAPTPALETYSLFVLDEQGVVRVDAEADPPTSATRLVVDHAGTVHVATQSISTVVR